jgi:hypothetical protein
VLARLLGIRLLRLEATVVLAPADVGAPSDYVPRARPEVIGGRLARAVRSIDEGAELLAEVRRDSA